MTLKTGSRGEAVRQVQALTGVTEDGIYGKQTEGAVRAWQLEHGLVSDGIAGAKTLAAMGIARDTLIECEDMKQYSAPHGSMIYGKDKSFSTYAKGGCGVTAFAIVSRAYGLCPGGETATGTIQRLGSFAVEKGYRIKGGGTRAALFSTNGCRSRAVSAGMIEACVREGSLVILNIKKGFSNGYAGSGHYVVAYGIRDGYLLLRDVGSGKPARQKARLNSLSKGLKGAWRIDRA